MTYQNARGPSPLIRFPKEGPYDIRLGYALLPDFISKLQKRGFTLISQARLSKTHAKIIDYGIFPIYREKSQTGITILDRKKNMIFSYHDPEQKYQSFGDVPELVRDTLLFIEDRNLLDPAQLKLNPAVDWRRFSKAIIQLAGNKLYRNSSRAPGGSTLATQIEKFRHSPEGRTGSPVEKLRQMLSASLRAYRNGRDNLLLRQQIVTDYLNSVPLAAFSGRGEVIGIADGLSTFFSVDFPQINQLLSQPVSPEENIRLKQALAYRMVLSLFLAHRRPSDYLNRDFSRLNEQVLLYLPLLKDAKIIDKQMFETLSTLQSPLRLIPRKQISSPSFLERKGANLIRSTLLSLLGIDRLYDLDRLDLQVNSTLDHLTQQRVTEILTKLSDKENVRKAGLEGFRLLDQKGDPGKIVYSFTLYERADKTNRLLVQTDNYNQPFNINQGAKLDLGSTAKLRTLITYLEIIEALHHQFASLPNTSLKQLQTSNSDPLTRWAVEHLLSTQDKSLKTMLAKSMERRYSANPGEAFFTAGGMHTFENFNKDDNGRILSVRDALRHSVNLPFIRLMRDIVSYYSLNVAGSTARTIKQMGDISRREYLSRFADSEGKQFLRNFYRKYRGKKRPEIFNILLEATQKSPKRFAAVFWMLTHDPDFEKFARFIRIAFPQREFDEQQLEKLYTMYSRNDYSLGDRAYLARIHPLELWMAAHLMRFPQSSLKEALDASTKERQEVYSWLFKTTRRHAQDRRIKMMIEQEAFVAIHKQWQKLGYPLNSLVPSLATALGTSADRPEALAELMGILVNDGKTLPTENISQLSFAEDTPFASVLRPDYSEPKQVLNPLIAGLVKDALVDIVENGTAVRLRGGFKKDGNRFVIGGKTGTGDHRFEVYGTGGRVKYSRVVNRTATFVFFIDNRFFGTVSAFVHGPEAAKFRFTSALPVQLLKSLEPAIEPLL